MELIFSVKLVVGWMARWHKLPPVITFRMSNSISFQFPVTEVVLEWSGVESCLFRMIQTFFLKVKRRKVRHEKKVTVLHEGFNLRTKKIKNP